MRTIPLVLGVVVAASVGVAVASCGSGESGGAIDPDGSTTTPDGAADGTTPGLDGSGGGDGGGGDGSVGYTPRALPGLVLWLESTLGVKSSPFVWSDQSGVGNDATVAVGSSAPDRNTASTSTHLGFGFHETEALTIADSPSLQWGTGDFLIEAVATNNYNNPKPDGGTTFTYQDGNYLRRRYGELYSKIATGFGPGPMLVYNDWTNRTYKMVGTIDGTDLLRASYDNELHLLGLRRKGSSLELRRDGAVVATSGDAGAEDVSVIGVPVAIGGRSGLTNLVGGIWELIAVKGATSDSDLAAFESYAKSKYGL